MNLSPTIISTLILVHLVTVILLFILKRSSILENFRSSKNHPASQGDTAIQAGGIVIIPVSLCILVILLNSLTSVTFAIQIASLIPIITLFFVGFIDDLKPISAFFRLVLHFLSATLITFLIYQLTGFSGLEEMTSLVGFFFPAVFMILAISWMINTTNFIDGMDLFLAISILPGIILFAFLHWLFDSEIILSLGYLILLSAMLGFVWFNRPKASIYMGDAGTLVLGFILGSTGVYIFARYGSIAGFIPFAYTLVDTTFTLIIRIINGLNPLKSHNQHAYQIAVKNGKSDTSIRTFCLIANITNTICAYLCFHYNHDLYWQLLLGIISFSISTYLFFYLRNFTFEINSKAT